MGTLGLLLADTHPSVDTHVDSNQGPKTAFQGSLSEVPLKF